MRRGIVLPLLALTIAACASSGVGLSREALPASLQPTYDRAQFGDKQALFKLGLAYADGTGVNRDCKIARRLLSQAATDTGGTLWVYSPPVGNGTTGRVIPIDRGPKQPGLKSASDLLANPDFCDESQS